jgi:hypothetical protein
MPSPKRKGNMGKNSGNGKYLNGTLAKYFPCKDQTEFDIESGRNKE